MCASLRVHLISVASKKKKGFLAFLCYCYAHGKTVKQSKSEGRRSFFWSSFTVNDFEFPFKRHSMAKLFW